MSFRVAAVVGDKRGRVGVGVAKGLDVASAVQKAIKQGERNMERILLKEERTIPHDVEASYGAAKVRIKPAKRGHGLIAGGSMRVVLELAGVRDVSAKIMGRTKNKISNAYATIAALRLLHVRQPKKVVPETIA
jgi:small subunit ribosomal protein S5